MNIKNSLHLIKENIDKADFCGLIIPVISILVAIFWIEEVPNLFTVSGGMMAIAGVIIFNAKKK